jgi:hypothetical protein
MIPEATIDEGDVVTVLAVPTLLVRDLPDVERAFLLALVGEAVTVSEVAPGHWVEIEAHDDAEGMTHFLRLAEVDVCRLSSSSGRDR